MTFTMTFSMTLTPAPRHLVIALLVVCGALVTPCEAQYRCTQSAVEACLPNHIADVDTLEMLKCSTRAKSCINTLEGRCEGHTAIRKISEYKDYICSAQGRRDYDAVVDCYSKGTEAQFITYEAALERCNDALDTESSWDRCSAYKTYDVCQYRVERALCPSNTGALRFWDKWGDLLEDYYCFPSGTYTRYRGAASVPHLTKLVMAAWVGVLSYVFI